MAVLRHGTVHSRSATLQTLGDEPLETQRNEEESSSEEDVEENEQPFFLCQLNM
jgi:hypothetical protein